MFSPKYGGQERYFLESVVINNMYKIFEILQSLTHEEFGVPAFRQKLSAFLGADLRRQERHPPSTPLGPRLNDHRLPHPGGLDESYK